MRLNGDVNLPANSNGDTARPVCWRPAPGTAPPAGLRSQGQAGDNSVIPLSAAAPTPTNDQTLAMVSTLLNGGGLGQLQDITQAVGTAFAGHGQDLRTFSNSSTSSSGISTIKKTTSLPPPTASTSCR